MIVDTPQQTGHGCFGQREHIGPNAESQLRIDLFHTDLMGRDVKTLLDLRPRPALERFVGQDLIAIGNLQESPKTPGRRQLIRLVGRKKLQKGPVFVAHPKTGYGLAPVDIKSPGRATQGTGDTGQKTGERGKVVVLVNDEAIIGI